MRIRRIVWCFFPKLSQQCISEYRIWIHCWWSVFCKSRIVWDVQWKRVWWPFVPRWNRFLSLDRWWPIASHISKWDVEIMEVKLILSDQLLSKCCLYKQLIVDALLGIVCTLLGVIDTLLWIVDTLLEVMATLLGIVDKLLRIANMWIRIADSLLGIMDTSLGIVDTLFDRDSESIFVYV